VSPCTGLRPGPRSSGRRLTVRAGGQARPSDVCKEVKTSWQTFQHFSFVGERLVWSFSLGGPAKFHMKPASAWEPRWHGPC
jgi:hypothetical protein